MNRQIQDSNAFLGIQEKLADVIEIINQIQAYLKSKRPASIPASVYEGVARLSENIPNLRKEIGDLEAERKDYRVLSQIGQVVNSSLDIDGVLQIVMDTIIRLTEAERGFLMLREDSGELLTRVARNWEQESIGPAEYAISRTVILRVVESGQPILTTNAREDPRFTGQDSVVAHNLRSILCVPLVSKRDVFGVIYADNRIRSGLFTQKDLELLSAFANQASVALQNANLFASVRKTLAEVTELKNVMDNVFSSIASGVLTADVEEKITLCNIAAEKIFGSTSKNLIGNQISEVLSPVASILTPFWQNVISDEEQIADLEASPILPERGKVDLRFSLSPLKDASNRTQGVAIVLEDLTERKKLEAQRRLFEKMVSPAVIEQLDPDSLELGGQRREISVLFADIRGFTGFSERTEPEQLVNVLNRYLSLAGEEILKVGGTIDKFLGDAVMAWFNAPIPQENHTLLAAKAALNISYSLNELNKSMPLEMRLNFGIGLHVGEAVLGLVGTEKRMEYTAIGDCINTAKRIQEHASENQVLISQMLYERIASKAKVTPLGFFEPKGKSQKVKIFELIELSD